MGTAESCHPPRPEANAPSRRSCQSVRPFAPESTVSARPRHKSCRLSQHRPTCPAKRNLYPDQTHPEATVSAHSRTGAPVKSAPPGNPRSGGPRRSMAPLVRSIVPSARLVLGQHVLVELGVVVPIVLGEGYGRAGMLVQDARHQVLEVVAPCRPALPELPAPRPMPE